MVQYFVGRECLGARIGHSGGKGCRGDTAAGCASPPPLPEVVRARVSAAGARLDGGLCAKPRGALRYARRSPADPDH